MREFITNWWTVGLVVVMIAATLLLARTLLPTTMPALSPRKSLLDKDQLRFWNVLNDAVDDDWQVVINARVEDLLIAEAESPRGGRAGLRGIRPFDFVLCEPRSLAPLLAIALHAADEPTGSQRRAERAADAACRAAGLPVLRFDATASHKADSIRQQIDAAIDE
jgi:hypothetical protein